MSLKSAREWLRKVIEEKGIQTVSFTDLCILLDRLAESEENPIVHEVYHYKCKHTKNMQEIKRLIDEMESIRNNYDEPDVIKQDCKKLKQLLRLEEGK